MNVRRRPSSTTMSGVIGTSPAGCLGRQRVFGDARRAGEAAFELAAVFEQERLGERRRADRAEQQLRRRAGERIEIAIRAGGTNLTRSPDVLFWSSIRGPTFHCHLVHQAVKRIRCRSAASSVQ